MSIISSAEANIGIFLKAQLSVSNIEAHCCWLHLLNISLMFCTHSAFFLLVNPCLLLITNPSYDSPVICPPILLATQQLPHHQYTPKMGKECSANQGSPLTLMQFFRWSIRLHIFSFLCAFLNFLLRAVHVPALSGLSVQEHN